MIEVVLALILGWPLPQTIAQADRSPASDGAVSIDEGGRLYGEAEQQFSQGRYADALELFQQALTLYQSRGDRPQEARILHYLGRTYSQLNQPEAALQAIAQALTLAEALDDPATTAGLLNTQGEIFFQQSDYAQAIAAYELSLALFQSLEDQRGEAQLLNNLGVVQQRLGQYSQASTTYQQALTRLDASPQPERHEDLRGIILTNQGDLYRMLRQFPQALAVYEQALAIHRQRGDRLREGATLNNLGAVYRSLRDYQQALQAHQQALAVFERLAAVDSSPDTQQLVEQYQQLLTTARQMNEQAGAAAADPARLQESLARYGQALDQYDQALGVLQELGEQVAAGTTLNQMGLVAHQLEDYPQAQAYYQQALDIFREMGDRQGEAAALSNLGLVLTRQGNDAAALEFYGQALAIQRQIQDTSGEAITWGNVGALMLRQQRPAIAILCYKQSVNLTEQIRQSVRPLPLEVQQSYTDTVAATYRTLADLLLQQDRVLEAQQVLELLKVQELEDYLQNVRGNGPNLAGLDYLPPEQDILALYDQAIAQGQELSQLRAIPPGDRTPQQQQRLAELVANQQTLMVGFDNFLNHPEVLAAVDRLSRTARRQNLDLEQLNALRDNLRTLEGAVLIYPLILDDRLELILVTPDAPPIRRTVPVGRSELNGAIAEFRLLLTNPVPRPLETETAQQLYQYLIQPLEDDLQQAGATTLLYAPDGQLRYIPLAALHDGEQWLVQRFRINHITAASLTDFDTPPDETMKVLAGAFTEGSVSFQVGTRQFSFGGLPFAGVEVNSIAAAIPGTTTLFDEAFSPQTTIPYMDDYSIVHLATHAEFVSGLPDESFILFGNGDRITLRDIATWSLPNVNLVVLSACQTAVGGELGNGEEVLGFGYQIQRTGARAAIASLWSVNDGGTQALMTAFYAALKRGLPKAEALRQAQISLITGGDEMRESPVAPQTSLQLNLPYYWAPFILIGNGL